MMVVMVMVMMMVSSRYYDDPSAATETVMMMMVMMPVLSQLNALASFSVRLIDSLERRHRIRNRFQKFGKGPGLQYFT
jgi:hypothetical protein